jgi:hypothetical protein
MALGEMSVERKNVNIAPEILYFADPISDAITLDTTAFSEGVCKAGTPIGAGGVIANSASALGVLLFDVYEDRPQGTIVVDGHIHTARAQAHSGVTIAAEAKAAMKNVVFH